MATDAAAEPFRIAAYHTELKRDGPGLMLRDILSGKDEQVLAIGNVAVALDADILVLFGVDYDHGGIALSALAEVMGGYPHQFTIRPNRGRASGADLNSDGRLGGQDDAIGYAAFNGQTGMAILSRFDIIEHAVRDLSHTPWGDIPNTLATEDEAKWPVSTTGHWDVPVRMPNGRQLHILMWHATPPVFDGPEDRNGRRNHDEAALWSAYLSGT